MEIIVKSRQLTASTALDIAYDMGAPRPRIVTIEEWNGAQAFLLTFGELSDRKQLALRPSMSHERAREIILEAMEEPKPAMVMAPPPPITYNPDPITQPIVPAPAQQKKRGRPRKDQA
jgi:hypothetical protein